MDPVASTGRDPSELLDVEVDELTGPLAFVATDRHPGRTIQPIQAREPATAKHRIDRRARMPELGTEAMRAVLGPHPWSADPRHFSIRQGTRAMQRSAGAILEAGHALFPEPSEPLVCGGARDPAHRCG